MNANIVGTLGAGSGIDIAALATQLANASKAPAEAALQRRSERNGARLSALADAFNGIDAFAKALDSLVGSGALRTAISSSDPSFATVRRTGSAALPVALPGTILVDALASAQVLESPLLAGPNTPVGAGVLRITVGQQVADVAVGAGADLTALAQAINQASSGVTASVLSDSSGSRLVLRGATGAANAFTVTLVDGDAGALGRFAQDAGVNGGLRLAQSAADARIRVDGVTLSSASNSFEGIVPGVAVDVRAVSGGKAVSIAVERPVTAIREAVENFVSSFNVLSQSLATGSTEQGSRQETAISALRRKLGELPSMILRNGQSPSTLAEIGVRTNRDGSLALDQTQLSAALASNPDAVEALFASFASSSSPSVVIEQASRLLPGSYQLTDLVAASANAPARGSVDGMEMDVSGDFLIAPASSTAAGLAVRLLPDTPATATITVDPGLAGALRAIRDELRRNDGAFAAARERLQAESRRIASDRDALARRSERYLASLNRIFASMDGRVAASRSTQSFLEQQVKIWSAQS